MDSNGFFHSDDAAAKLAGIHYIFNCDFSFTESASGHELKGAMAYYNCHIPGLHTPMIAVIDYRGFIHSPSLEEGSK